MGVKVKKVIALIVTLIGLVAGVATIYEVFFSNSDTATVNESVNSVSNDLNALRPEEVYSFCFKNATNRLAVKDFFKMNDGKSFKDEIEFYGADELAEEIKVSFIVKKGVADICFLNVIFDKSFTTTISKLGFKEKAFLHAKVNYNKYVDDFEGVYISEIKKP